MPVAIIDGSSTANPCDTGAAIIADDERKLAGVEVIGAVISDNKIEKDLGVTGVTQR
jgi:hypothetical protein